MNYWFDISKNLVIAYSYSSVFGRFFDFSELLSNCPLHWSNGRDGVRACCTPRQCVGPCSNLLCLPTWSRSPLFRILINSIHVIKCPISQREKKGGKKMLYCSGFFWDYCSVITLGFSQPIIISSNSLLYHCSQKVRSFRIS